MEGGKGDHRGSATEDGGETRGTDGGGDTEKRPRDRPEDAGEAGTDAGRNGRRNAATEDGDRPRDLPRGRKQYIRDSRRDKKVVRLYDVVCRVRGEGAEILRLGAMGAGEKICPDGNYYPPFVVFD